MSWNVPESGKIPMPIRGICTVELLEGDSIQVVPKFNGDLPIARKVAAVDDLLAALESLCHYGSSAPASSGGFCAYCDSSEKYHDQHPDCLVMIGRAAIAKAKGE